MADTIGAQQIENPIRKIRTDLGYTQREFADIADVTEQVVLKTEQGLYPNLPPSMSHTAKHLSNLSVGLLEAAYLDWINQELLKVKLPPETDTRWRSQQDFPAWRMEVCRANKVANSVNGLSKLLKLNPYVLQKWEGGILKAVPIQLIERLAFIRGAFDE